MRELKDKVHRMLLRIRSIEAVLETRRFERLWVDSTKEQKEKCSDLIDKGERVLLQKWIREHPSLDLGEHPIASLRQKGKELRIKHYSRLSKCELIAALKKEEEENV